MLVASLLRLFRAPLDFRRLTIYQFFRELVDGMRFRRENRYFAIIQKENLLRVL
ncbi:hypothetical protein D3C83_269510 [compost metagenome]